MPWVTCQAPSSALALGSRNEVHRRTRYSAPNDMTATALIPRIAKAANNRSGAPTAKNSPIRMKAMIMALPKSPSSVTRNMITPPTGANGMRSVGQSVTGRYLRVRTSAPHTTSASLAISEGCSRKGPPRSIQFCWPCTDTPMPGTSTRRSRRTATPMAGQARPRTVDVGSREAKYNAARPMMANRACLATRSVLPPVSRMLSMADADQTMISPRRSRNSVAPSIR